jgi:hypothetical protein
MNLSLHFTLEEMLASQTATRLSIDEQFSPPDSIRENLKALCESVLEPIRAGVDSPIHISSGYRCERDNNAIGGAKTSQHTKGQAADISTANKTVEELYLLIKNSDIDFDQLIQEFDRWVHVSYTAVGVNRKECLRAIKVNGVTKYIPDNA